MLVVQIVLLLLLVSLSAAVLVTMVCVLRGAAKRRLFAETCCTLCDASDSVGISVLCSGARNVEQTSALLDVGYDRYEVVLVMDAGRYAEIFADLAAHYYLFSVSHTLAGELPAEGVCGLYRSRKRCFRRLVVVDKVFTTVADDLNAAAGVATYDYVLPMCEKWRLMPNAIGRLAAELSEHPAGSLDLVRSLMGVPGLLLSREAVVSAGGFAQRPWNRIPRSRTCMVYEPLLRSDRTPRPVGRFRSLLLALLLAAGIGTTVVSGWWTLCAVWLTIAVVWGAVRVAAPLIADGTGYAVNSSSVVAFLLREFNVKNFTIS